MGSCDDPAVIGEPFRGSVTQLVRCSSQPLPKQQSRQKMTSCPSNYSEGQMFESDRGLGALATNICTNSSEPAAAGEDGTFRGSEHADTLILDERLDSDSGVSDPFLNEENDACNLENRTLSLDTKESQDVDGIVGISGCRTTMDMVSLTGSSANCVKPDELDDNSCVIAESSKVERDDTVDDSPILEQMGTCTDDLKSPSHVSEIVSNLASANGFPSDFIQIQQNKPDNDGAGCSFSDSVDRITDASVEIVADMLNEMSPLQSDQILSIHVGQSVANYDQYICQMDGKSLSGTSGETVTEVADMNSNPVSCLQVLPSRGCQRIREYLQSDGSLTIHSPENDGCDEKHVNNSSKYIPKVVEEDIDILTYDNGDAREHIVRKIENDCNLEEAIFRVNPNCVELLALPLPSQPPDFGKDGFYEMLSAEDILIKDISSVNSCDVGCQDNNDIEKVGCVSEVKCPETVVLSSKRSGRRRASSQKSLTKRALRKSKKKLPQPLIFDTSRKRRSSISRPARPSPWGSLGYIIQSFEKSGNDLVNQSQKQGNKKSKGNQGGTKRNKKQASDSSHRSRKGTQGKCATSTNCIRLKVKLGKNSGHNFLNIMVPEVADSSLSAKGISCNYGNESYWEGNLEFPQLTHGVDDQKPEEGPLRKIFCYNRNQEKEEICPDGSVVKEQCVNNDSSFTVIAEKSSEKHADDNHCISSHLVEPVERAGDTRSLDPGTSPDSEVINSILDIQVGAMRQETLQDSVLASSEDFAASGNVTSSKKGRKKAKSNQVVSCSQEGGSSAPPCRNRSKSSKKHGRRRNVENQLGSSETFTSTGANVLNYSLNSKELSMEQVPLSTEIAFPEEALKADGILKVKECSKIDVGGVFSESENSKTLFPTQSARKKHPKISKSVKTSKGKYKAPGSRNNIKNASKEKVYQRKSVNKSKIKKAICDQAVTGMESHQVVGTSIFFDLEHTCR